MRAVIVTTTDASGTPKNSPTIPLDLFSDEAALQVVVSGTATYSIQQTLDDPFGPAALNWFDHPDINLVGSTVNRQGNYDFVPRAIRLRQTAGTGSVTLTVTQPTPGL